MATPLTLTTLSPPPLSLTAACQRLTIDTPTRVTVRSNLADPALWPVVAEHKCNQTSLTPSGLYADMALTVAQYFWKKHRGSAEADVPGIKVYDLDVDKPLIVQVPPSEEGQWIEMDAVLTLPSAQSYGEAGDIRDGQLSFQFRSVAADSGAKLVDLAHCSASYEWWPGWLAEWAHWAPAIQGKIDRLEARARAEAAGHVRQVDRARAYELFKSFVDYGPPYQNMAEVVFDAETLEGTARLGFRMDLLPQDGLVGPYLLDGTCHVSGFVCNAVEPDRERYAYISHGVDAVRLAPTFDPMAAAEVRNYVRMEPLPSDKTVLCGDVYVLQDGCVVGIWEGVKFKKIPRRVLNVFLPPPKTKTQRI